MCNALYKNFAELFGRGEMLEKREAEYNKGTIRVAKVTGVLSEFPGEKSPGLNGLSYEVTCKLITLTQTSSVRLLSLLGRAELAQLFIRSVINYHLEVGFKAMCGG